MNNLEKEVVCKITKKTICRKKDPKSKGYGYHCIVERDCELNRRNKEKNVANIVVHDGKTYTRLI